MVHELSGSTCKLVSLKPQDFKTYQRALHAIGILHGVVAVVPRTTILRGVEAVHKVVPRGDRALSHSIDTIHLHAAQLTNTVPVDARAVVFHVVGNVNVDCLPVELACMLVSLLNL